MKQYQGLILHLLEEGRKKGDRTGTGTRSIFGCQMRFDLNQGFPLVTTKKSMWKGAVGELRWFLAGSTDVKWLQDNGVAFWNEWKNQEGTIGHGYGRQFRHLEYLTPVEPKIYEPSPAEPVTLGPLPEPVWSSDTGSTAFKVGDSVTTKTSGEVVIIEEIPAKEVSERTSWVIGFKDTGYVREVSYGDLLTKSVKDVYQRSVHGVGYYGVYDKEDPHLSTLVNVWRDMIGRCYDEGAKEYGSYGELGVHVCEEWQCFANFQEDAKKLDGWTLKVEYPKEYSIDKDTLWASNRYSVHTCMWASEDVQNANRSNSRYFTAVSPEGHTEFFYSVGEAKRRHGLNISAVHRCLNGGLKTHHGWSCFSYVEGFQGKVTRYQRVDQLKSVIASLKHDPDSRRHLITLWNPLDLPRTTLPPCHGSIIQFYVSCDEAGNKRLSCQMYQRSCDAFLGLPVNIAVYSLLTHLMAHHLGMEPGEFVWVGGDVHLYQNHLEQAQEVLNRDPRPLPKLHLNHSPDLPLDEVRYEDLELEGYDPHPAIPAPVAV